MKELLSKLFAWVAVVAVAASLFLYARLTLVEAELSSAKKELAAFEQIVEAQNRITARENEIASLLRQATRRIEDAPNAQVLVPPDVAVAWANAIDSLRDDAGVTNGTTEVVSRPNPPKTYRDKSGSGAAERILSPAGSSIPGVSQSPKGSG